MKSFVVCIWHDGLINFCFILWWLILYRNRGTHYDCFPSCHYYMFFVFIYFYLYSLFLWKLPILFPYWGISLRSCFVLEDVNYYHILIIFKLGGIFKSLAAVLMSWQAFALKIVKLNGDTFAYVLQTFYWCWGLLGQDCIFLLILNPWCMLLFVWVSFFSLFSVILLNQCTQSCKSGRFFTCIGSLDTSCWAQTKEWDQV